MKRTIKYGSYLYLKSGSGRGRSRRWKKTWVPWDQPSPNVEQERQVGQDPGPSTTTGFDFDEVPVADVDSGDEEIEPTSSWSLRRQLLREKWGHLVGVLVLLVRWVWASQPKPNCGTCPECQAKYDEESCFPSFCKDCGMIGVCSQCAMKLHGRHGWIHRLEIYKRGFYVPLKYPPASITLSSQSLTPHHNDCTVKNREIVCIDGFGYQHKVTFDFCNCEEEGSQLLRLGYWPGSPVHPKLALSVDFMEYLRVMHLECQVSVKKFCDAVCCKYEPWTTVYTKDIYQVLLNGCFAAYRTFHRKQRYCSQIGQFDDGTACPGCPVANGTVFECFDGCFGLVRKISSGNPDDPSGLGRLFFCPQEEVDHCVETHSSSKPSSAEPKDCHNFHAGESVTSQYSKGKSVKLDEKGLMGSVCRHDHPKRFFNCKFGERIGYSVYALEQLVKDEPSNSKVFVYDIACKLKRHLKAFDCSDILQSVKLAIPSFHAYGHVLSCQINYSPKRIEGLGLTDGEGAERLWAYLREFAKITKEMTAGNRMDTLSDAILHFGERKRAALGPLLAAKFIRCKETMKEATQTLESLLTEAENVTEVTIRSWCDEERGQHDEGLDPALPSWQQQYVADLLLLESTRTSLNGLASTNDASTAAKALRKVNRIEKRILVTERVHVIRERWTWQSPELQTTLDQTVNVEQDAFLRECLTHANDRSVLLQRRYKVAPGGQKLQKRLNDQINRSTSHIRRKVTLFQARMRSLQRPCLFLFADLLLPSSEAYSSVTREAFTHAGSQQKGELVDAFLLTQRAKEEQLLLEKEADACVRFYELHHSSLLNSVMELSHGRDDDAIRLLHNSLLRTAMFLERFRAYILPHIDRLELSEAVMATLAHSDVDIKESLTASASGNVSAAEDTDEPLSGSSGDDDDE